MRVGRRDALDEIQEIRSRVESVEWQIDIVLSCKQSECITMRREMDNLHTSNAALDKTLKECYEQVIANGNMANCNYDAISQDFDRLRAEVHEAVATFDVDAFKNQLNHMSLTIQIQVDRRLDVIRGG